MQIHHHDIIIIIIAIIIIVSIISIDINPVAGRYAGNHQSPGVAPQAVLQEPGQLAVPVIVE